MHGDGQDGDGQDGDRVRGAVRERYAALARRHDGASPTTHDDAADCGCAPTCCGRSGATGSTRSIPAAGSSRIGSSRIGTDPITDGLYTGSFAEESVALSATALAASLGCGNPHLLADLAPGETVLDLGSGGGLDVLLSARRVGPDGMAYGVDMTEEMLDLARRNQAQAGITNASFLRGTIEDLPLRDGLVDVVISNCVINLAADKRSVLAEAFRVTRPGGRFAVADIVLLRDVPEAARRVMGLWTGCISGALRDEDYLRLLTDVGYTDACVEVTRQYTRDDLRGLAAGLAAESPDQAAELLGQDHGDQDHGDQDHGGLDGLLDSLDGAVASAFVRARRPS